MPAQAHAQGLAPHPVAVFPQFDPWAPGTVTAFMVVEHGEYFRFPGRFAGLYRPCRPPVPPGIVAAGHHVQHLARVLDVVMNALLINELQRAYGVEGCEKRATAFLKCPAPAPSLY